MKQSGSKIYFDNHATTAPDPAVVEAMMPFWAGAFGNASSNEHGRGLDAALAVDKARRSVANAIGADAREIVFTSGATEANNMALIGGMRRQMRKGRDHLIIVKTEHKCVLESALALEAEGFRVSRLGVNQHGQISLDELKANLGEQTGIVSIMTVNNEIGTIQPIKEIATLVHDAGALLHSDAAQALGKVPLNVRESGVDLLSLSAHKAYGPMGIGALYLRHKPRARIEPLLHGGGQERGLRAGTQPTPLVVGFGKACELVGVHLRTDLARITRLRTRVTRDVPGLKLNGSKDSRIPHNLNLSFDSISRTELFAALSNFEVSSGSACSDNDIAASYVLRAIGLTELEAKSSVRICFGRTTSEEDVSALIEVLNSLYDGQTSPVQSGKAA